MATIVFAVVATLIFWSSAFVGIRQGLMEYTPGALALLRYFVASITMLLMYPWIPKPKDIRYATKIQMLLLGCLGIGIYNLALNFGELHVKAASASFIIGLMPSLTILLSALLFKEKLSLKLCFGILCSLVGVFMITIGDVLGFSVEAGMGIILISTISVSFYSILQKKFLKTVHPLYFVAYAIWGGTLFLSMFILDLFKEFPATSLKTQLNVIYLGVFPGAIAFACWSFVLSKLSTKNAAVSLTLMPLLTTVMGWVFLRETLAPIALLGGAFSIASTYLVIKTKAQEKAQALKI